MYSLRNFVRRYKDHFRYVWGTKNCDKCLRYAANATRTCTSNLLSLYRKAESVKRTFHSLIKFKPKS